jgi:Leucine-rich repeat (LRR) protein
MDAAAVGPESQTCRFHMSHLKSLIVLNLSITGAKIPSIKCLESLKVIACPKRYSSVVKDEDRLSNLRKLDLHRAAVTVDVLQGIKGPALYELDLRTVGITDQSLSFIIEQLPDLTSLTLQDVDGITDVGVRRLAALKNLKWLNGFDCSLSAEIKSELQQALPDCHVDHRSSAN